MNNILWTPLDLPLPPKELTLDSLKNHYHFVPKISKEKRSELEQQKKHHLYAWNSFSIHLPNQFTGNPYEIQVENFSWDWTNEAKNLCPRLIDYIKEHLPFYRFKYITAISSNGQVPMHLDLRNDIKQEEKNTYKNNDPCFYRILLDGYLKKDTFYVFTKTLGKVFCTLPISSPGWAMGSFSCAHGNDEVESNQKLLLYVMGDLDIKRHKDLIARSARIYKEYAVIKDYVV